MTLHAGDRLGAYEILGPLGSGGMGEVWRARDSRLKRDVAIKVLPDSLAADPVARVRFDREARAVAALSHPNILDIHDVGSEGGVAFAVTELLEGQTLKARLDEGALPWRRAVEVALALAEGLEAAHARGVVHRDVKPSNVFLTSDGRVKILDFGIATLDDSAALSAGGRDVTETHAIVGTAGYLSPEQIRHEAADARSDIFSLGCVLYEMVTGRRTFPGDTPPEALVATLRGEPRDPADLVTGLPPELRRLILRCLEKRPDRRFQTAADLAFALKIPFTSSGAAREFVSATDETEVIAPAPAARPRPRAASAAAGGVLFASVLCAAAWLVFFRGPAPITSVVVLPFEVDAGSADEQYLADAVSESLRNAAARLPDMAVYRYRDARVDPRKAARDVRARAVLTGHVSRRGAEVVVQADLVDGRDGRQIWGERLVRPAAAAGAEEDLAASLVHALRPALESSGSARKARHDPEALDLVRRGRHLLARRTEDGIGKGLALFEEAAARDPSEALAWLGLADAYNLLAYYSAAPATELVPKQRAAAERAAALDPGLAGAYATLADARYAYDHDWEGAERLFRRALALDPNDVQARQWYSNFLSASSRFDESLKEIRRARELDPLGIVVNVDLGLASYWAGDDAAASAGLARALEIEPASAIAHLYAGLPAWRQKNADLAIAEFGKAVALSGGEPDAVAFHAYACGRSGRMAEAEADRARLEEMAKTRFVSAFPKAILALGLGRNEEAVQRIREGFEERAGRFVYLNVERGFDPVRADPRVVEVVRLMRIPPPR